MFDLQNLLLTAISGLLAIAVYSEVSKSNEPLQDFSVMTFNLRSSDMNDPGLSAWSYRKPVALDLIHDYHPDIVGMQEITPTQRQDLDQDLVNYWSVGIGREPDNKGEQCPVYLKNGPQAIDHGTFWLSETPNVPSIGWDARMPRVCTWVKYPGLTIYNTHLDYAGPEARRKSLALIRRHASGSAIIMGDFNDNEGSTALEPVSDFVDAYQSVNPHSTPGAEDIAENATYHAFQGDNHASPRIDFILVSPDLEVRNAEIVKSTGPVFPSDHYPVLVHLHKNV